MWMCESRRVLHIDRSMGDSQFRRFHRNHSGVSGGFGSPVYQYVYGNTTYYYQTDIPQEEGYTVGIHQSGSNSFRGNNYIDSDISSHQSSLNSTGVAPRVRFLVPIMAHAEDQGSPLHGMADGSDSSQRQRWGNSKLPWRNACTGQENASNAEASDQSAGQQDKDSEILYKRDRRVVGSGRIIREPKGPENNRSWREKDTAVETHGTCTTERKASNSGRPWREEAHSKGTHDTADGEKKNTRDFKGNWREKVPPQPARGANVNETGVSKDARSNVKEALPLRRSYNPREKRSSHVSFNKEFRKAKPKPRGKTEQNENPEMAVAVMNSNHDPTPRKFIDNLFRDKLQFGIDESKTKERPGKGGKSGKIILRLVFPNRTEAIKARDLCLENKENSSELGLVFTLMDQHKEQSVVASKVKEDLMRKGNLCIMEHMAKIEDLVKLLNNTVDTENGVTAQRMKIRFEERQAREEKLAELDRQRTEFVDYMEQVTSRIECLEDGVPDYQREIKEIRKAFGIECCRLRQALPMYARRKEIVRNVEENQVTIVLGETGSGKSTQLTQYLYQVGMGEKGLIVCTQPRRVAAVSLARRVSSELASNVGTLVGYKAGQTVKQSPETQILYMTDYCLLMECLNDPNLSKYSCVIIDEAHERSLFSDILIGMIKKILERRPSMKVIISSATMDTELFRKYFMSFSCRVLKISGRTFPVEVIWKEPTAEEESGGIIDESLKKVLEIHDKEEDGDILVFVTSPLETEKACEALIGRNRNDIQPMQLHGKLQPEDQQAVFDPAPAGKRKIVFATNCAETSITIPGIKYVVDTGFVKEKRYDPGKNMSSLEVRPTSKSSAEQRRGRAGRMEAGKCYRLYDKAFYDSMEISSVPEILRVQLGHAILSLISLGIMDPLNFDFVESPSKTALEAAMEELIGLGAVEGGEMTELGRKISKLPLSPKLGKLVIEGAHQGLGMEALVIAAVSTTSGSLFFRMGTDAEKEQADIRRLPFCLKSGDLMTFLELYRRWLGIEDRIKSHWCVQHYINAKSMRIVRETIGEIRKTLERDVDLRIEFQLQPPSEETTTKIRRLIFCCFKSNICMSAGHKRAGYILGERHTETAQIHPSSSLRYLDEMPKWLVYDNFLKTSQNFILDVTPIEEAWVIESIKEGSLKIDLDCLSNQMLVKTEFCNFGDLFMKWCFQYDNRKHLRSMLAEECGDTPLVLQVDRRKCLVEFYCRGTFSEYVISRLNAQIDPGKEKLRNEIQDSVLPGTNTKVTLCSGCRVQAILLPGEFRSIIVKNASYRDSDEEILERFSQYGAVETSVIFDHPRNVTRYDWGKIIYERKQDAAEAVRDTARKTETSMELLFAKPEIPIRRSVQKVGFVYKFEWCRRRSRGFGYLRFKEPEDLIMAMDDVQHMEVGSSCARFMINSKCNDLKELRMTNLDVDVNDSDLRAALKEKLGQRYETVEKVVLILEKSYPTPPDELVSFENSLRDYVNSNVPETMKDAFEVDVRPPNDGTVLLRGKVVFTNLQDGESVANRFDDGYMFGNGTMRSRVKITPELTAHFWIAKHLFAKIKPSIEEVAAQIAEAQGDHVRFHINQPAKDRAGGGIRIFSDEVTAHFFAVRLVKDLVEGVEIEYQEDLRSYIFGRDGQGDLEKLTGDLVGTCIKADRRNKQLRIHGAERGRTIAKDRLDEYLEKLTREKPLVVSLGGSGKPRGLIGALVKKYGGDMQLLKDDTGVTEACIDFRRKLLKVRGSDDAVSGVESRVTEIIEELLEIDTNREDPEEVECCICLMPFEDYSLLYRLQCCGHAYCTPCLKRQIEVCVQDKEFPLTCGSCADPLTFPDWLRVFKRHDKFNQKIVEASLEAFVKENSTQYRFCPTADCKGIYRVSDKETAMDYRCEVCGAVICTACHTQHQGMSCEMNRKIKEDPDHGLKAWLQENPANRKLCPKCRAPVEKNGGCRHMHCTKCKIDFCWLCLETFASSKDCYNHLSSVHGGIFGLLD